MIAFLAITLPLTWWWLEGGNALYSDLYKAVGRPVYRFLGVTDASLRARTRYMNFIPFIGLLLVTPGLSARRKLIGLAIGLPAILASHLLLNLSATRANGYQLPPAYRLMADGFPILLWALLAREPLSRLGAGAFRRAEPPEPPEPTESPEPPEPTE